MPIVKKEADREAVSAAVAGLEGALRAAGVRVKVDAGTEKTPGWKFNHWEMKVRLQGAGACGVALACLCGARNLPAAHDVV